MRKGIDEVYRSVKGNSSIRSGNITDYKAIGCPKVDTLYLQLIRDGKELLFMGLTPEEARIIGKQLLCLSVEGEKV